MEIDLETVSTKKIMTDHGWLGRKDLMVGSHLQVFIESSSGPRL